MTLIGLELCQGMMLSQHVIRMQLGIGGRQLFSELIGRQRKQSCADLLCVQPVSKLCCDEIVKSDFRSVLGR